MFGWSTLLYAQQSDIYGEDKPAGSDKPDKGFKIGKLRLHPGFSLQTVFDSNVSNASSQYASADYLRIFGGYSQIPETNYDLVLHIIGAFKLNYPDDTVSVTLNLVADYARYMGLDNSDTTIMSGLTGSARLTVSLFPKAIAGFDIEEEFIRSVQPKQVGLATTFDRIHNNASGTLHVRPGGGQLRFELGYQHQFERYDESNQKNLNWMHHEFHLNWELEFFPKTAFFMASSFAIRDYYEFDPLRDNLQTNAASPNAMPLKLLAGVMGRVTSKLLINVAAGYGNSFSKNYASFNHVIGKLELTGQFTPTTVLKGGFERGFSPIVTYSYLAENKIYLEFKQWLFDNKFKIYLYSSYSFLEYGPADQGVDLDQAVGSVLRLPEDRNDRELTVTPSLRYDFLVWLNMEIGYTLTWHDTGYWVRRVNSSETGSAFYLGDTYYDYLKHEAFLKLTIAY
jgi:hypothetical protein